MNTNAHALIIGISAYQQVSKLPRAVINDAGDIHDLLISPAQGGYIKENVRLLTDFGATKQNLCNALEGLVQNTQPDSTVFVYFSGHGAQLEAGPYQGEYLLPVDTDYSSAGRLAATALSGSDFTAYIRAIKARRLVVVFDCCHSGGIGAPKDPTTPMMKQGLPEIYYEQLQTGRGRVIIASSRSSEVSFVLPGAHNSVFTQCLLEGLRGGVPGLGGVIRIFDLFHYLQPKVTALQPNQHPIFKAELEENFPLVLYKGGKAPAEVPLTTPKDIFTYDVFVSYRQQEPDKTWVKRVLVPTMVGKGLKVCVDYKSFRIGVPLVKEMERAVVDSRYTLAVLTPTYLKSNFTEFEQIMATHLGLEQSQRRFLAILREECQPNLSIRVRMWLDMTDDEEFTQNAERLVFELKQSPDM